MKKFLAFLFFGLLVSGLLAQSPQFGAGVNAGPVTPGSGGGGAVASVFGRTGVVAAQAADYAALYAALTGGNTFSGTQTMGAVVATTVNGNTFTTGTYTLTGAASKTLTFSNSLTFAGTDATTLTFQGTDTYVGRATTDTLTNKRITSRIATLTDAATVTPATDSFDGGILTTLSQATTLANPTGTPTDFQKYTLRIKSIASRALTYGTQFRGSADLLLPATTSGASLTDYLVFQWNAADSKWDIVGRNFGF